VNVACCLNEYEYEYKYEYRYEYEYLYGSMDAKKISWPRMRPTNGAALPLPSALLPVLREFCETENYNNQFKVKVLFGSSRLGQ